MFVCLSPGGQHLTQGEVAKNKLLVGTVDGIFSFQKENGSWQREAVLDDTVLLVRRGDAGRGRQHVGLEAQAGLGLRQEAGADRIAAETLWQGVVDHMQDAPVAHRRFPARSTIT